MRSRLSQVIFTFLLLCQPVAAVPQKSAGKPDDKSGGAPVNEIGGRKLEQWLADVPSKDPSKAENALRTVLLFGPERAYAAAPVILKELKKHGPGAHLDTSVRAQAVLTLGMILGAAQKPDPKVDAEAVRVLDRLLNDSQSVVKYRAAEALGRLGPQARAALPRLLRAAADTDTYEVRGAAVAALGTVGVADKGAADVEVVAALCKALRDDASQVRLAAARSLLWLGAPADADSKKEAVAALGAAAKDVEPTLRMTAHMALLRIKGPGNETHVAAIGKFLEDEDPVLRMQAAEALGTVGAEAKSQLPRLIKALDDREGRVVNWSIWALGRMGEAAVRALPRLREFAGDKRRSERLRQLAAEAVEVIQGKKKS